MAAGREEGVPVTQGWHSLLPAHLAGRAQPSGASLPAGTSHGKREPGGAALLRAQLGELPDLPWQGSPPNFPLRGVTSEGSS